MQPLCHICNLSLTEGVFPHQIKIASLSYCIRLMIQCHSVIIDLCHSFVFYIKSLRNFCIPDCLIFLEKFKMIYDNKFGFRKGTQLTWH